MICPIAKKCGGCQLQNLSYEEQLSLKQSKIIKLMGKYCHIDEIIGMEDPLHYRNKISRAFGFHSGRIISGIYQSASGRIIQTDSCLLEDSYADKITKTVRELCIALHIKAYDIKSGRGFFRHVLVRRGGNSGETMVVLVTAKGAFPQKDELVNSLIKKHPDITTVVWNINTEVTPLFLGEKTTVLYGNGYITDTLLGNKYRISAKSFYQVNTKQTEILYSKVREFASLNGREYILDAYCGTGTIGLSLARGAKSVIGVEVNGDAVTDAEENAKINSITNASFINADAGEYMQSMAEKGEKFDIVITDPPRSGCSKKFLESLITLSPKKVIYVSCNPETLTRDLFTLRKGGYRIRKIQPVDMFPNTSHVEVVVCLSREKADDCEDEPKMISDERSKYKSWSNLKKQMNDLLCDSLKDKISYFYTSYHEVHNAYGRATINYNKKEMVAFSWVEMYAQEREVSQLYQEGKKVSYGELEKGKWIPECKLCDADFINSLTIYLKTDIAISLHSDNYLLRVFAYMDRRVGKRTLIKIKDDVEKLPDWVKQFYQIRCEADSIVFHLNELQTRVRSEK